MIQSRIGWLVWFFWKKQGVSYNQKLGKGAFGKELQALLAEESPIAPENLIPIENLGIHKMDGSLNIPKRYEDEYFNQEIKMAA